MKSLLRGLLLMLIGLIFARAVAIEPFVIDDIRLEGLQRISAGTVFNYLPIKVGETLDDARSSEALRALFKTGFFKDVRLEREGGVLVISVSERPAIASIKISGNKDIETDSLLAALEQQGFSEGRVFDRSVLDKVEQELNRQYFTRGKYAVKVTTSVTPLERNRVAVAIEVSEGVAARIREINIVGNEQFSDKNLLENFELSSSTLLSFYTRSDQYSKQKLTADLEALRSYYLDRGYINFTIDSTQVSITPDKKDIYLTININEGEQFLVSEIKLAGELIVPEEELFKSIEVRQGSIFSRKEATETSMKISEQLGNEGYAFSNVNIIPSIKPDTNEVALTFFVDPGRRVYVRRINFIGNTKTRDEVLRREMRQIEGGWFSTAQIERSRVRLQRLDYFQEVNVETPAVPGATDQVDVNIGVVEKPSGNLLAGVGFSQSQGIILNASVSQDNFLGSGKRVSVAFNNSDVNRTYSLGYTNPYYTIDGISRGFNIFSRSTDFGDANIADFTTDTVGAFVNYGIPINEFDSISLGLGYEGLEINQSERTAIEFREFLAINGSDFDTIKLTAGIARDSRNRAVFADRGGLQSLSAEVALPGADLEFYKVNYRLLRLFPLSKSFTLSLNGEVGYGDSYGDSSQFPFFENFLAGGVRSIRGFEDNTLGPRSATDNDPLGGNLRVVGNIEMFFPPPFFKDNKAVRLGAFFDFGNVYGVDEDFDAGELRYSAGLAATWVSPFGPLTFSLGQPLNDKEDDDVQVFQFQLGTTF